LEHLTEKYLSYGRRIEFISMDRIEISVVIPTYNRKNILIKCLSALFNQNYPKERYEVIVVDDGSTDGTEELIRKMGIISPCSLRFFKQKKKGPAAARNLGIKNAQGRLILFTDDDCIADKNLIREHVGLHEIYYNENIAILGYTTWHPELRVTPFMYWLEHGGPQFAYYRLKHGEEANYFYACNISLKRSFMLENGLFDENFPYAAHEDTEIGYRLKKKGLKIIFNKNAVTYHYHPTDVEKYCYRMKIVGRSAVILNKKHPSIFQLPSQVQNNSMRSKILDIIVPPLKKLCYLADQKGYKCPSIFMRMILNYYYKKGVKEMLKECDKHSD
jgi:glycosyltransferase involved in cell wall biosynthesis